MKYKCGCFMYDLPSKSCVFCQKCDVFYDYSGGIYMLICSDNKSIMENGMWLKGCNERESFPLGTMFEISDDDILLKKLTEFSKLYEPKKEK